MLTFMKRRAPQAQQDRKRRHRNRQQNIKASADCMAAFAALADAHGVSKAALFEDMVAERYETLQR
jgi:hypothetical protein